MTALLAHLHAGSGTRTRTITDCRDHPRTTGCARERTGPDRRHPQASIITALEPHCVVRRVERGVDCSELRPVRWHRTPQSQSRPLRHDGDGKAICTAPWSRRRMPMPFGAAVPQLQSCDIRTMPPVALPAAPQIGSHCESVRTRRDRAGAAGRRAPGARRQSRALKLRAGCGPYSGFSKSAGSSRTPASA
jgi:hypothetical protein